MKITLSLLVGGLLSLSSHAGDNFADATAIEFLAAEITETVTGTTVGATAEENEPAHAGLPATNSFWYKLTVDEARRVEVLSTTTNNLVFALYTGESLATLTPVSRYAKLERPASSQGLAPDDEPFILRARINFDAVPETTYYLAVDNEGTAATFTFTLSASRDPLDPEFEVIPAGAEWSYYQALNGNNTLDPATAETDPDTDFYTTWFTSAAYDGPAFSEPQATPIGYGAISGDPVRLPGSTIVTPTSGQRQAVTYFRTTFTPERQIEELGFEGLLDDGAVIYINGTEVTRINVSPTVELNSTTTAISSSFTSPAGALSSENFIQYGIASDLNLPIGEEVEIAVSMHNAGPTSSDSSFNLRVYATKITPITEVNLRFRSGGALNSYELIWDAQEGLGYRVEFSNTGLAPEDWNPEVQGTQTATETGPLNRFVVTNSDIAFWRVITILPGDDE